MTPTSTREAGLTRLAQFLPSAGARYAKTRNYDCGPSGEESHVSRLSPWLHSGLLSEREVIARTLSKHSPKAAESFVSEVFWRLYFKGYLEQRPGIWRAYCEERDAAFARIEGNSGLRTAYTQAVEGRTGIEAFDTWAHELVHTGYLHNHARMWFASIWIFTLKLDWQLGADFFLRHLIDGDAASNTLSWRWIGGLHTKGKTYLARADNISTYTVNRAAGPLTAEGIAEDAPALEEAHEHGRQPLDLPETPKEDSFEHPYVLLLHDDAASHVPLDLPKPPALVIGAVRPQERSPKEIGSLTRDFSNGAVTSGVEAAGEVFDCPSYILEREADLADILSDAGITRLAVPYLPIGWTRDALMPLLEPLVEQDGIIPLLDPVRASTWPLARAGFFKVKKAIPDILGEAGIAGG